MKKALLLFLVLLVLGSSLVLAGPKLLAKTVPAGPLTELVKVGENVDVPLGTEVKSAVAVGGSVTVNGKVEKDVVAVGGSVTLKDQAVVGGDAVAIGGQVKKEPGAVINGDITELSIARLGPLTKVVAKSVNEKNLSFAGLALGGLALFSFLIFVGYLALVAVLVALFTPQLGFISATIEKNPLRVFLWGLLTPFGALLLAIIMLISIIGIVLLPLLAMLLGAACLFGYIAVSHLVGKKILYAVRIRGRAMMFETLTGAIILFLVSLVPVLGALVKAVLALAGLGAVLITRFGCQMKYACCQ